MKILGHLDPRHKIIGNNDDAPGEFIASLEHHLGLPSKPMFDLVRPVVSQVRWADEKSSLVLSVVVQKEECLIGFAQTHLIAEISSPMKVGDHLFTSTSLVWKECLPQFGVDPILFDGAMFLFLERGPQCFDMRGEQLVVDVVLFAKVNGLCVARVCDGERFAGLGLAQVFA